MVLSLCRRVRRVRTCGRSIWPGTSACPPPAPRASRNGFIGRPSWSISCRGPSSGACSAGCFIRAGERRAGLGFPRLQRGLRRHHFGLRLERSAGCCGPAWWCCWLTARLLVADDLRDAHRATGFIPQQDQGRLHLERAVARFLFAGADQGGRRQDREDRRCTPKASATWSP